MTTTESDTSATSRIGQTVSGRYLIRDLLGEGGMGAVYLAEHTHMRKRVALKLLHSDVSNDEEILARFRREAEAAARIEHPNVAAATDFGRLEDGSFFLVLEYVEGTSLRDALRPGAMPAARALHVTRQIALALERAHESGIVHRDLKPENVMLVKKDDDPDFVKVLDFGIAKVDPITPREGSDQPLTRLGTILGTPEYMAPEQALGEAVGPAADLYALGVMLYEMLTGKHPFDAHDRMAVLSMHIVAPVPPMGDRAPAIEVPILIEALVRRLLEKEAKARPPSARALLDELREAAAASNVDFTPPPAPSVHSNPRMSASRISAPLGPVAPGWSHSDSVAKTSHGELTTGPGLGGVPSGVPSGAPSVPQAATVAPMKRAAAAASPGGGVPARSPLDTILSLPRGVLLGLAAGLPLVFVFLVVVIVLAVRGPRPVTASADGGTTKDAPAAKSRYASNDRVSNARALGPTALEALATEYPDDPLVAREIVLAHDRAGSFEAALAKIPILVKLDETAAAERSRTPSRNDAGGASIDPARAKSFVDAEVIAVVTAALARETTAEHATNLLETTLGAKGVDALLDVANAKGASRETKARASKSLSKPDVRANASPAAAVYFELKTPGACSAKRDAVVRAKDVGDARALPALRAMKNRRGCGFLGVSDCYPCLRRDRALDDAIDEIEGRGPGNP